MARVKLSEFRAKTLLVPNYDGRSIMLDELSRGVEGLADDRRYVVKVDQGIKKRGKQGLVAVDVSRAEVAECVTRFAEKGFTRFIVEPLFAHDQADERYLSIERTAQGLLVSYSPHGGVDVEEHASDVQSTYNLNDIPLPRPFLDGVIQVMNDEHMSFVEINPLVVQGDTCSLLDAAVLVDSTAETYTHWTEHDVVEAREQTEAESTIAELNANSTAALSFRVLNANGAIWLLLSGGGASITIADEAHNAGRAELVGDYGEYSGGPTTEETYLYTKAVLGQMLQSTAPKLALVIAGGVANFTDVRKTFTGIIQALTERIGECQTRNLRVFVRRGGPNEKEGLALMETFLKEHDIYGSVHGSTVVLTDVIHEALGYIDA